MAEEEAKYTVIQKDGKFQVREYEARVVAETYVDGSFTEAANMAFGRLFDYIAGKNTATEKIAMTAPVTQQTNPASSGEKIAMTAPVTQQENDGKYRVTFILPASYTMATAPTPKDEKVALVEEPVNRAATVTYSGTWSKSNYDKYLGELEDWMTSNSLEAKGDPVWARYNPPYSIPLFRRNEIIIPLDDPGTTATATGDAKAKD